MATKKKPANAAPPTTGVSAPAQLVLGRRAEAMIIRKGTPLSPQYIESMTREDAHRMLAALHLHQIELEMQNQALAAAQIALEESRDRLEESHGSYVDLYDHAPVGYLTLTDRGLISDINLIGAALLGVERGKVLQQPFARFVSPDDADRWHLHLVKALKQDARLNCAFAVHPQQGMPIFVRFDCLRWIEDGQAPTVRMTLTDISELKQKEKMLCESVTELKQKEKMLCESVTELRLANENIKLAERAANAGTISWNFKTGDTQWSDELFRLFGLNRYSNTASHATWQAAVHPEDRQKAAMGLADAIRDRKSLHQEYRVVLPGGRIRWISGHGDLVFDDTGQPQSGNGFCVDITARKEAEIELNQYRNQLEERVLARTASLAQARDAAETSNRAKDVFLHTMSHELRTPLHTILGTSELLMLGITDPQQRDMLGQSLRAGKQLLAIVNDVIDLSNSEADALILTEVNFSPRSVLDEIVADKAAAMRAKKLRLVMEIDPAVAGVLRGDSLRFKQILHNFIDNAIKFSVRGLITVRIHCSKPDRLSQCLRIEVKDEGIGIGPDQQARLFLPFAQRDGSTTRAYGGIGLGLALCRRLARLMGGEAGVSSVEGSGSLFWATVQLRLPGESAAKSTD